jgi:hypothetical protein
MVKNKFYKRYFILCILCWCTITCAQLNSSPAKQDSVVTNSDSLKAQESTKTDISQHPAIPAFVYAPIDTIGDEEEIDSWENYGTNEYLPWWLEIDSGRDYDPRDPRDREQERDTRE